MQRRKYATDEERRAAQRASRKKWKAKNKGRVSERAKASQREAMKRYRARHREKLQESNARYRANNPPDADKKAADNERCRRWRLRNLDRERARSQAYKEAHRDRCRAYGRERQRALRRALGIPARGSGVRRVRPALTATPLTAEERANNRSAWLSLPDMLAAIWCSVPRTLPADVRDDVAQDIVVAALGGEIAPSDLHIKAPRFVSAYYRGREWLSLRSLDARVFGDGPALVETISEGMWP